MKQIYYTKSPIEDNGYNIYYVQFNHNSYTIKATEDGFYYIEKIWKEAGYEVIKGMRPKQEKVA